MTKFWNNKIYYLGLVFLFALASPQVSSAQSSFGIHTDLMDFTVNGASLWINYDKDNHRVFAAGGFNTLPDFLNSESDLFVEKRDYFVQLGYGYKFGEQKNFIVGGQLMYKDLTVMAKATSEEMDLKVFRLCPIVLYEWYFINSVPQLCLTPWASYRIDVLRQQANFPQAGLTYQSALGNFAMGFNLGYTFSFD